MFVRFTTPVMFVNLLIAMKFANPGPYKSHLFKFQSEISHDSQKLYVSLYEQFCHFILVSGGAESPALSKSSIKRDAII